MKYELSIYNINGALLVDSREVSQMVVKFHSNLCRDIKVYNNILLNSQNSNLSSDKFFIESSYIAGTRKGYRCYLLTKKGCDMVAGKLKIDQRLMFEEIYKRAFGINDTVETIEPVEIIQDPAHQETITTTTNANQIKSFNNELFGQVRFVEINEKPYAVGSDVAKALGYVKPNNAINAHCKGVTLIQGITTDSMGRVQKI